MLSDRLTQIPPSKIMEENSIVNIREKVVTGFINIRGKPETEDFMTGAKNVLGFTLPTEPNTVTCSNGLSALWLGPDEWMVIVEGRQPEKLAAAMDESLVDVFSSVTDVTGGHIVFNVSGSKARDLLEKGCTIDLHPTAFGVRACVQTLIAKANVVIRYIDDTSSFDLVVRSSFASYLQQWLNDAALEYILTGHLE